MIKAKIRNFRGIQSADISAAPIALVAGVNYAAKTSVIQALAAAATGMVTANIDIPKKDAAELVHDGSEKGWVELSSDGAEKIGAIGVEWPACKTAMTGDPPRASAFAAGLSSLPMMGPIERASALERYLSSVPTKEDLIAELAGKLSSKSVDSLWAMIERDGWDRVHTDQVTERQKNTGAWGQVTGENFGSSKANGWTPKNWDPLLAEIGPDKLNENLAEEQRNLEQAIASLAIGKTDLERLRNLAGRAAELDELVDSLVKKQADNQLALETARSKSLANAGTQNKGLACPHCGELIRVNRDLTTTTLEKFTLPDPKEESARRLAKADADAAVSNLQIAKSHIDADLAQARANAREANEARASLKEIPEGAEGGGVTSATVDHYRSRVDRIKEEIRILKTKTDADAIYRTWEARQAVIDALKPDGLRRKKLSEAVEVFNLTQLAPLCSTAGWPAVEITEDDLGTVYGNRGDHRRRYALLSESEQMRARVILQIAQARLDGSDLVLIDRADLLDARGRNGLFTLLKTVKLPAVVGMMFSRRDLAPDLAKIKLGETYWLEDGKIAA